MNLISWLRPVSLLLCLSVAALSAAEANKPEPPPPETEIKTWHFDADIDSRRAATLFQGEEIDHVIAKMGEPRGRSKKKKDPTKEEVRYIRKVPGPLVQKQASTRDGMRTFRYQALFTDEITLVFMNGRLQNAKTYRTRSDDSSHDSLPPFMR